MAYHVPRVLKWSPFETLIVIFGWRCGGVVLHYTAEEIGSERNTTLFKVAQQCQAWNEVVLPCIVTPFVSKVRRG